MSRDARADRRRRKRMRRRNQAWADRKARHWVMKVCESAIRVHEALELTRAALEITRAARLRAGEAR